MTIPLDLAYLCVDCNSIGQCANICQSCSSTHLLGLAAILNRTTQPSAAESARKEVQ